MLSVAILLAACSGQTAQKEESIKKDEPVAEEKKT